MKEACRRKRERSSAFTLLLLFHTAILATAAVDAPIGGHAAEPSFWRDAKGFFEAVDWDEPFILALGGLHACLWAVFVVWRRSAGVLATLILIVVVLVGLSKCLNDWAFHQWSSFSRQNYFDKSGIFLLVVWATPLLVLGFSALTRLLWLTSQLLIKVKRRELRTNKGRQTEQEGGEEGRRIYRTHLDDEGEVRRRQATCNSNK